MRGRNPEPTSLEYDRRVLEVSPAVYTEGAHIPARTESLDDSTLRLQVGVFNTRT